MPHPKNRRDILRCELPDNGRDSDNPGCWFHHRTAKQQHDSRANSEVNRSTTQKCRRMSGDERSAVEVVIVTGQRLMKIQTNRQIE